MKLSSIGILAGFAVTVAGISSVTAQNITLDNVVPNDGDSFPSLTFTQFGSDGGGPIHAYNFSFGVTAGTGSGASLVGGNYLGFCVNLFLPDPTTGDNMAVDSTGGVLSYSFNGSSDVWKADTAIKYDALKDVLFAYEPLFTSTSRSSQQFYDMTAAFSVLTNEIVIDYDGTLGSIDLSSGNNTVTDSSGDPISGNVVAYYNAMYGQIGNGKGSGFQLYSAAWPDSDATAGPQDMVFFAIPEPSVLSLTPMAALMLLRRRRKTVRG